MAPVVVAGGGIAGLTTALCLARAGVPAEVYERAPVFSEVGAGLQLSPNAARILRWLGLDVALDPVLGKPDALVVRRGATGTVIVEMPLGDAAERRWGAPTWVAHRADLLTALLEAIEREPAVTVTPDMPVTFHGESDAGADVSIGPGEHARRVTAPLLVAADGLWSAVRQRIVGGGPPQPSGYSAFRATVPIDAVPGLLRRNATGLWLGPGAHLVHYPLRGGAIVNLVAILADARRGEGWDEAALTAEVAARFSGWCGLARDLVAAPAAWRRWALHDRPADTTWPLGTVALVGDAAHPMLPFLAQGASMAIEDAAVLARHVAAAPRAPREAVARYASERLPRVARVQAESRRNARIFHLSGPFAAARDLVIGALGPQGMMARYDWLYGFEA